jgi:hypothetical protein
VAGCPGGVGDVLQDRQQSGRFERGRDHGLARAHPPDRLDVETGYVRTLAGDHLESLPAGGSLSGTQVITHRA